MDKTLVFNAGDAKSRFGEMLDASIANPVGIRRHSRLISYLVSKDAYESLQRKVDELEDQVWLHLAEQARNEGYVSEKRVEAHLERMLKASDEKAVTNKVSR